MSRTSIPYWHVDAFADRLFAGNQAAVVTVEQWPSAATMRAIAAENLFAETAFLRPAVTGDADYDLRWFTPTMEVALCGHATLAAGHVLLAEDQDLSTVRFQTGKAGLLEVHRTEDGYELALPAIRVAQDPPEGIADGLGIAPEEMRYNSLGYIIARYPDEASVRSLAPDIASLARHGDTMFIATAPGDEVDVVSRVFVPGAGVPEDSVTGSAHAALTPYWCERLNVASFTAHQASARGGDLTCRLADDRAILGGQCVTVVEGRLYLSR